VIHLERVRLPDGLRALAYRDRNGNLVIYVSEGLDAKGQRAAIMAAIRASRRAGWRRTGLLPAGIVLFLAIRALLKRFRSTIGTRPVAWGAAATATVVGASAAGIFIASAPHPHGPSLAGRPPGPGTTQPNQPSDQQAAGHTTRRHQVHPVAVAKVSPAPGQPASSGQPPPAPTAPAGPSPATPAPAPAPSSAPSPTASQPPPAPTPPPPPPPAPLPTPTPTGGTPGICVIILGIKVCLPAISESPQV